MIRHPHALLVVALMGCTTPPQGAVRPVPDAEHAAFTRDLSEAESQAVLALANAASLETLDEDIALDVRAATGIIDRRPFDTMEQLDAVPYVGPVALARLLDYAQATGLLDHGPQIVHGIEEGSPLALDMLRLVNSASFQVLDEAVALDRRAASNIVAARQEVDLPSLAALDAVPWVGASAF